MINKSRQPREGSPTCLITSIITDRIGRDKVLLPIHHNYNKICDVLAFFEIKTQEIPRVFLLVVEKKSNLSKLEQWCVLSNYTGMTCTLLLHCAISVEIRTVGSQSDLRILL